MIQDELEKEAEEYTNKFIKTHKEGDEFIDTYTVTLAKGYEAGFKDGAEFGYNKANEWHKQDIDDIYDLNCTSKGDITMKPNRVEICKHFETCESGKTSCVGCNIWNYLYDAKALISWCKKHHEDIALFTMKMHKELKNND